TDYAARSTGPVRSGGRFAVRRLRRAHVSCRRTLAPLIDAASAYYRGAGHFAWHFARGKLGADPVFAAILARGLLHGRVRILDLGCGQGLLAAWLLAARAVHASDAPHAWPHGWP